MSPEQKAMVNFVWFGWWCFSGTSPNAAALKVAQDLIQCAVDKGYLIPDYLLVGHSDVVNTLSPGQALYDKIKTWPHFKH